MATEGTYPHIVKREGDVARLRANPRVRVAQIVIDYLGGWGPEEQCRQYPHLGLAETFMALAYYFDHKQEIDSEIEEYRRDSEEGLAARDANPSPLIKRLRALRKAQSEGS